MRRLAMLLLIGLIAAGCQSDRLVNPTGTGAPSSDALAAGGPDYRLPPPGAPGLRIMTYNVYLGTDFSPVIAAGSVQDFLTATARAYGELQQTNFPARAGKIADQIAAARPDVVGLEEVGIWSVSSPYAPGGPPLVPFVVQYDFLQLVLDSLAARHLAYRAAAADTTSDVAAPVPTAFDGQGNPTAFALIRFQDRDAIIVRAGVRWRDARHGVYTAFIPLDLQGTQTGEYRGWSSIEALADGRAIRIVDSHLEADDGQVNLAQAQEQLGLLRNETDPVVWVGDFNSGPGVTSDFASTYALVTGSSFTDLWPVAHPHDPGLTNGPADGVGTLDANGVLVPYPTLVFTTRVDLVLLRDAGGRPHDLHAATFGDRPDDRTAGGLYPSDHAAVGMVFDLPFGLAGR